MKNCSSLSNILHSRRSCQDNFMSIQEKWFSWAITYSIFVTIFIISVKSCFNFMEEKCVSKELKLINLWRNMFLSVINLCLCLCLVIAVQMYYRKTCFGVLEFRRKCPCWCICSRKLIALKLRLLEILTHCIENCWSLGSCMNIWIDVL